MGVFDWLFPDPSDEPKKHLNEIPGTMKPYYDPYINAGREALQGVQGQYNNLINDPGGMVNKIGGGYQQSPGFQFALQQALQGANHGAAAGGMAGSPQHEQQNMNVATNLANQDYNAWLQNALNMYGGGLTGMGNLSNVGYGASNELAQSLANALAGKANLEYAGQANQNQLTGGLLGNLIGAFSGSGSGGGGGNGLAQAGLNVSKMFA